MVIDVVVGTMPMQIPAVLLQSLPDPPRRVSTACIIVTRRAIEAEDLPWTRFEFTWDARPGEHVVMTRATDEAGNTQPDAVPFNEKGYLFNQPVPHPIRVT